MPTFKHEPAIGSPPHGQAKLPYRAPKLEVLGSLRSATRGSSGFLADMGTMRMFAVMMSDRRLKEDIVRIGQHALGLGIYRFRYKAPYAEIYGAGRRVGVMADEVAEKYPDAVCRHPDGHLMVDYGLLFH
jgi:hypothetical protein